MQLYNNEWKDLEMNWNFVPLPFAQTCTGQ